MSKKIIVSTDSCSDIPKEIVDKFNICVLPMPVTLGDKSYLDGVDIKAPDVFDYYNNTKTLAKTSTPNTAEVEDYFEKLTNSGENAVIHFSISSDLSGAYNYARIAAEEFEDVYCINSKNLSTGIALLIYKTCELVESGMDIKDIVDNINETIEKVDTSFVIDTLEYLHKGGRCSSVAMLGSNLLKLKPCIEVKDGKMDVGKKYRGKMEVVLKQYVDDRLVNTDDIDLSRCFVTHTYTDDTTVPDMIKEYVSQKLPFAEIIENSAGCTISAHCGPATLGILFLRKTPIN